MVVRVLGARFKSGAQMVESHDTIKIGIENRGCGIPVIEGMRTCHKSKAWEALAMEGKLDPIIINMDDRVESLEYSFEVLKGHFIGRLETFQINV